ncbi:MAG: hypothetical protein M1376_07710 [Planctomycetes bacterium]|nr:hypothetical protein [Planctomycetota bacterium]
MALGEPKVSADTFEWHYQIRNDSAQDIWVCGNLEIHCCEVHLAHDNETLLIQRRLNLPAERLPGLQPFGRYVRLRKGETRTELVSFSLPIQPEYVVSQRRQERPLEHATHVVLEIGYYAGDLLGMILNSVHEAEMYSRKYPPYLAPEKYDPSYHLGGTTEAFLGLNNEGRASKSEWISVPYTWQTFKGERTLRLAADGVRIPYLEQDRQVPRPDLTKCTRAEMEFTPSALDFFFPYANEQSLLSPSEKQHLQSMHIVVVNDQELLRTLAQEVRKGVRDSFVWEHGAAQLTCYNDDQRLASLRVYDGSKTVTSQGQIFQYEYPGGLRSLSGVTAQVRAFDRRIQCAANLRDLWYRFRLYHRVKGTIPRQPSGEGPKSYPRAAKWCDDISSAYRSLGKAVLQPLKCPIADGRCHYAMNPACAYGSVPNKVLLFETKSGWNQHGGPELFTFDNHDPKGGLVLLNDGTVKFIRTEEELKQLRWK